ncbi:GNAT family N-acetyltransferase [Salinicoccus halitifaciens]|uniref:GNAT superfamily N-acetyltransferase n=1 Tax=Salinicoccus halitifaciens TaxID=1073415 RepID=A0ABV2E6Z4_9STAP|nr:GNAT family N-acetyltransferase [Salinicoccus halitifaciens]MCD2136762.1 GNAT family N-acetyltransferase [Salinicoccus halitifaciens]
MNDIRELKTEAELTEAFPIMQQLRTHLDLRTYLELIKEAQEKHDYRMHALYDAEEIVAVIGYMPMTTLYYGRFLWICDFVTDSNKRSKGYGRKLLSFIEDQAAKDGYESVSLSSGLQRKDAHRFYEEKMNYDKKSYVFKLDL